MQPLHARRLASIALLGSIAWLPDVARAQSPLTFQHGNTIPWPWGATAPVFTRTVRGEFTGDGVWDAFVQAGAEPVFLFAPRVHSAVVPTGLAVNDMDCAAGAGIGGRDALAFVDANGLRHCRFDPATGAFGTQTVASGAVWLGAKKVRAADLDGSGGVDYLGVGSDLRTVIVRRHVAGGAMFQTTFQASEDVLDLAPVQWVAPGSKRIVLMTTYGLEVHEQTGTLVVRHRDNGYDGDAMAVFHCGTETTDRVAWTLRNAAGTEQHLMQATPSGGNQFLLAMDTLQSVSLSAADGDVAGGGGDGDDELVVGNELKWAPILMENSHPTTPIFTHLYSQFVNPIPLLDGTATGNAAMSLYRDFDGDEFPDVLIPVQSPANFVVVEGVGNRLPFDSEETILDARALSITTADMGPLEFQLALDPSGSSWTHLQVIVWHQDVLDAPLAQVAESNSLFDLADIPTETPPGQLFPHLELEDGDTCGATAIHWIETRFVQATIDTSTSTGKVTKAGTSYVCAVSFDVNTLSELDEDPDTTLVCIKDGDSACDFCDNGGDETVYAPAFITRRKIRAPPPSIPVVPDPGPAEVVEWQPFTAW